MIERSIKSTVVKALARQAAVAIIGPRQVGKTTLAKEIAKEIPSIYIDLESPRDRAKLSDTELFFSLHENILVILDEIHRMPEIFQVLRGVIDSRRTNKTRNGHFLILGSASINLLKQSGETLAGRIEYVDMTPLNVKEVPHAQDSVNKLRLRGGFPESFLAVSDEESNVFRENFIRTYLERDVPMFGPKIPAETLRRMWTMLAHNQGSLLNASKLAANLGVSAPSIVRYIDLLVDLLLVRRLHPFHVNTGKRLVKSPKTYVRDSGLLHTLLGIESYDELLGHPIIGASWEGFVIENILENAPKNVQASFYRTTGGAEIDLVLDMGHQKGRWAIEIKRGLAPKPERGYLNAIEDLSPTKAFIVYSGMEKYPLSKETEVISLKEIVEEVSGSVTRE